MTETKDRESASADLLEQLENQHVRVRQLAENLRTITEELRKSTKGHPRETTRLQSLAAPSQELISNLQRTLDFIGGQRAELQTLECSVSAVINATLNNESTLNEGITSGLSNDTLQRPKWPLSSEEYSRYGRQLVLPEISLQGQLRLKAANILVIGGGGLGCPAAAYLAGAGVGHISIVDGDTVEISNLHRQILHSTPKVGMSKVDSIIQYINSLNPLVRSTAHRVPITPETALSLIAPHDLVLDCTDNPATRYLISDACVLAGKPLVSASALRTDGQLMALNCPPRPAGDASGGPCYRCVFPKPPPPETVVSCGEGGILGPVVGVMGVLQALEAIKLIAAGNVSTGVGDPTQIPIPETTSTKPHPPPSLLVFSSNSMPAFRHIKLRGRRANCAACSDTARITKESLTTGGLDYIQFCGVVAPVKLLSQSERITAMQYNTQYMSWQKENHVLKQRSGTDKNNGNKTGPFSERQGRDVSEEAKAEPILLDVRPREYFDLYALPRSINIPFTDLSRWSSKADVPDILVTAEMDVKGQEAPPIYVLCAQGNDSQHTVRKLQQLGLDLNGKRYIGDIEDGWKALKRLDNQQSYYNWPDI